MAKTPVVGHPLRPSADERRATRSPALHTVWLDAERGAARGWVVDLSESGARVGGAGSWLKVSDRVVFKVLIAEHEPPLVLRAEVVRYHTPTADPAASAPQVCLRFIEGRVESWFRLARFLDNGRGAAHT